MVVSMEQALAIQADWLNFNRFRLRSEHTLPLGPYRLMLCGKGVLLCTTYAPGCSRRR